MFRMLQLRAMSGGNCTIPAVGTVICLSRTFRDEDLRKFVLLTGDNNPIHATKSDTDKSPTDTKHDIFVNGAFLNAVIAGIIGTHFPGFVVTTQTFSFPNRCHLDRAVLFSVRVEELRKIVTVSYESKQNDRIVFEGTAKLFAVRK